MVTMNGKTKRLTDRTLRGLKDLLDPFALLTAASLPRPMTNQGNAWSPSYNWSQLYLPLIFWEVLAIRCNNTQWGNTCQCWVFGPGTDGEDVLDDMDIYEPSITHPAFNLWARTEASPRILLGIVRGIEPSSHSVILRHRSALRVIIDIEILKFNPSAGTSVPG